jgi:putative ATP-binding cassette transporter
MNTTFLLQDEATSALDVVSEANMYSLLRDMARKELKRAGSDDKPMLSRPGLTFISVGHRPTLLAYHDIKLRLSGGSYTLESVEKSVTIPMDIPML